MLGLKTLKAVARYKKKKGVKDSSRYMGIKTKKGLRYREDGRGSTLIGRTDQQVKFKACDSSRERLLAEFKVIERNKLTLKVSKIILIVGER